MKKLLYTFLIGLVVISCNKEEIGSGNAPLSLSQDITVINSNALEGLIDGIINYDIPASKKGTTVSTNKSTTDYLKLSLFTFDSRSFFTFVDETNDDLCFTSYTVAVEGSYVNVNGDGSVLQVVNADGAETLRITGDFSVLFDAAQNVIFEYNPTTFDIINIGIITEDNRVTGLLL